MNTNDAVIEIEDMLARSREKQSGFTLEQSYYIEGYETALERVLDLLRK